MQVTSECEDAADGRWIAEVPQLPAVPSYGSTAEEAMAKAEVLALRLMPGVWNRASPARLRSALPFRVLHESLAGSSNANPARTLLCCAKSGRISLSQFTR